MGWLECDHLSRIPWLRHAFSTRVLHRNGRLLNSFEAVGISPDQLFLKRLGVETLALATLRQIHSSVVHYVWSPSSLKYTPAGCTPAHAATGALPCGDALLTDQPGILLSVRTADCVPLLLVDPARQAIAAVHAGWRGSLERIAEKTVGEMRRAFHTQPEELLAAIGPSIRACCYEVGEEVVEAFHGRFTQCDGYFREPPLGDASRVPALQRSLLVLSTKPQGRAAEGVAAAHLDLVAVTRDQLRNAGIRSANIQVADFCTACRTDLFFSYRKEGKTGRMIAVIGMV